MLSFYFHNKLLVLTGVHELLVLSVADFDIKASLSTESEQKLAPAHFYSHLLGRDSRLLYWLEYRYCEPTPVPLHVSLISLTL